MNFILNLWYLITQVIGATPAVSQTIFGIMADIRSRDQETSPSK